MFLPNFLKMVNDLAKDPNVISATITPVSADLLHAFLGMGDELIELYQGISDYDTSKDKEAAYENIVEELGDALFYSVIAMNRLCKISDQSTSMFQVLEAKMQPKEIKLSYRSIVDLSSECITAAKKVAIYNKPLDYAYLQELVALVFITQNTIQRACGVYNVSFEAIQEANMKKLLKGRYASGTYSDEQALNRADKV
jgi:NTP pyrophosphatase (non-canonical NTP hydrolase)